MDDCGKEQKVGWVKGEKGQKGVDKEKKNTNIDDLEIITLLYLI